MHLFKKKKKKKTYLKNMGQLDPSCNLTRPMTRLTCLKMTHFDQ